MFDCEMAENRIGVGPCLEARRSPGRPSMTFRSILNPLRDGDLAAEMSEAPACFRDLNLDQIVASIAIGKQEYNLAPFFYQPLKTVEAVEYRQDVMRDLQEPLRLEAVNVCRERPPRRFGNMSLRRRSSTTSSKAWPGRSTRSNFTVSAVKLLLSALRAAPPRSAGLAGFFAYLAAYVASPAFPTND